MSTPKHHIVVGIDGFKSSATTLEWAVRQAELTGSTLEIMSTWEWPIVFGGISPLPTDYDPEKDATKALDNVVQSVRDNHPEVVIHSTVRQGRPAATLASIHRLTPEMPA